MAEITITEANFDEEVTGSGQTVLLDFWAPWCGPCRMVAPVVAEIAEECGDRVKVGKINVDEEQALARRYNVMSIPTLMVFKNGAPAETAVGFRPKEEILKLLG